jgi:hypothetical protein
MWPVTFVVEAGRHSKAPKGRLVRFRLMLGGYAAPSKAVRKGYGCNMGWSCEGGGVGSIDGRI